MLPSKLASFLLPLTLVACATAEDDGSLAGEDVAIDEVAGVVSDDDLNGLWNAVVDGVEVPDEVVIESWSAVGIRVTVGDEVYQLSRSGDTLSSTAGSLVVDANGGGAADDTLSGSLGGRTLELTRDVEIKPPITLTFPGDRPWRAFLEDTVTPLAQRDRESYKQLNKYKTGPFLRSCELYKTGSWVRKYMKGETLSEQYANFNRMISEINYFKSTPRRLTREYRFFNTVNKYLKDPALAGLAMSTFSMYFSTGAGGALRMPITNDSVAYFITDKPSRGARIGLVAMDTPDRGPLASTFGRQLLDLGEMPASDSPLYARAMMDLLAKSDVSAATALSPIGRTALTDYYAVMAIEDYRGMAFGYPSLGWGYNMTNVQFYGLIVRALGGQVIVGSELRPGDPSYADVLNNGNDMQEYSDMARLKRLASDYLKLNHPALVNELRAAFTGIVPDSALDYRAKADLFHYITAQLYDSAGRSKNLLGAQADRAVTAVTTLLATLESERTQLEAYILSQGITKSSVPAPKSTGF